MERDCIISHGMALFLKERTLEVADAYSTYVCGTCGLFAQRKMQKSNSSYAKPNDIYWWIIANNSHMMASSWHSEQHNQIQGKSCNNISKYLTLMSFRGTICYSDNPEPSFKIYLKKVQRLNGYGLENIFPDSGSGINII